MIKTALKLALTGLICWWILSFVPLRDIANAIGQAAWIPALGGMAGFFAMRLVAAGRMTILAHIQSLKLRYRDLLALHLKAGFYAMLLPGIVLGGAATWVKYVQAGASKRAALASVLVNRLVALTVLFALSLAAWAFETGPTTWLGFLALLAAVAGVLVSIVILFIRPRLLLLPLQIIHVVKLPKGLKLAERLQSVSDGLAVMQNAGSIRILVIYLLSLVFELCAVVGMLFFAVALEVELSLATLCWLRGAVVLVQFLPISFLGLGVREATLMGLTASYGVDPAKAVAWSLTIFGAGIVMALIGGLLELIALFRTNKNDNNRNQQSVGDRDGG